MANTFVARHDCGRMVNGKQWAHCCICDGRMHEDGCTTRRNPKVDCCESRHKRLHHAGQTRGLSDSSQAMWSESQPFGYHDPQVDA